MLFVVTFRANLLLFYWGCVTLSKVVQVKHSWGSLRPSHVLKLAGVHNAENIQSVLSAMLFYGLVPTCTPSFALLKCTLITGLGFLSMLPWKHAVGVCRGQASVLQIRPGLPERLCPLGICPHKLSSRNVQFGISHQWLQIGSGRD